jgi:hypothetical protein
MYPFSMAGKAEKTVHNVTTRYKIFVSGCGNWDTLRSFQLASNVKTF